MAHTPGPWRAEDTNGAKLSKVAVAAPGLNGSTCVIGQCAGPDREANARLIAAAPALLEACEIMDAAVKAGHTSSSDLLTHLLEAAAAARAALAAARAEAQPHA